MGELGWLEGLYIYRGWLVVSERWLGVSELKEEDRKRGGGWVED